VKITYFITIGLTPHPEWIPEPAVIPVPTSAAIDIKWFYPDVDDDHLGPQKRTPL
jgi:hypothetical protein